MESCLVGRIFGDFKVKNIANITYNCVCTVCGRCLRIKYKTLVFDPVAVLCLHETNPTEYSREHALNITYRGKTQTLTEWARELGISVSGMSRRVSRGGNPDHIFSSTKHRFFRDEKFITVDGESLSVSEWAKRTGITRSAIYRRLSTGWDEKAAVTTSTQKSKKLITFNGETLSLQAWSKKLGIHRDTLYSRLYIYDMPIEEAFTAPIKRAK